VNIDNIDNILTELADYVDTHQISNQWFTNRLNTTLTFVGLPFNFEDAAQVDLLKRRLSQMLEEKKRINTATWAVTICGVTAGVLAIPLTIDSVEGHLVNVAVYASIIAVCLIATAIFAGIGKYHMERQQHQTPLLPSMMSSMRAVNRLFEIEGIINKAEERGIIPVNPLPQPQGQFNPALNLN